MKLLVSMHGTENDKQRHLPLSRVMSVQRMWKQPVAFPDIIVCQMYCFRGDINKKLIIMTKTMCPLAYSPGVYSKREIQSRMSCIKRLKSSMKVLSNPNKAFRKMYGHRKCMDYEKNNNLHRLWYSLAPVVCRHTK